MGVLRHGDGVAYMSAFPIVHTDDLPRLIAFYEGVMRLPITYRYPTTGEAEFVVVAVGDAALGLGTYGGVERLAGPQRRGGRPFEMCFYSDDLEEDVERLREASAEIVCEPDDMPWGERMAYAADPDGNLIMVAQRNSKRR
jgi:lactoylglutathione lyase